MAATKPKQSYADEPARSPALRINNLQPFNAEPHLKDLANAGLITPDEVRLFCWYCCTDPV